MNAPALADEDGSAVLAAVRDGWISGAAPQIAVFERAWADYCGRRYGVAVSSGTTALELALEALDLHPGDEVILPTFTIISCALAVLRAGATPVLVDADPETRCLDAAEAVERIGPRTRAIMAVHIDGHPCDMNPLLDAAARHGAAIVEDAAEAHGAEYRAGDAWRRCGAFGRLSTFSFYANKLVTCGEGGMVLTDDEALARRLRGDRDLDFDSRRRFVHHRLAHQYRLGGLAAALGVSQTSRADDLLARKRALAAAYSARLADVGALQLPVERSWARSSYWMYGIVLREEAGLDAAQLAGTLARRGIETRPFFVGMHEQPALRARGLFADTRFPVAERLARRGLHLPSSATLGENELERICDTIRERLR